MRFYAILQLQHRCCLLYLVFLHYFHLATKNVASLFLIGWLMLLASNYFYHLFCCWRPSCCRRLWCSMFETSVANVLAAVFVPGVITIVWFLAIFVLLCCWRPFSYPRRSSSCWFLLLGLILIFSGVPAIAGVPAVTCSPVVVSLLLVTYLKVHKHDFFKTFFAETETLWSQGPVTRDFWKSYSIRPRYSTFKHFHACSACDETGSQVAQHAMKLVPRMLSVR